MNCLCCGKPLRIETENGWHKSCIRRFFGTDKIPQIDISESKLKELASEAVNDGFTVPGVQKKLSLHLFSQKDGARLTLVDFPTGYILKPQVREFESLPEAEHLVMCMAQQCSISTVPHALIYERENFAYITKRVDRIFENGSVKMLAMEDFCQLDQRLTQDKYRGSYERCAKIIDRYSCRSKLDMAEFFKRIVFSFVVGNSDMHLKNFSLIETSENSREYVLSPAYDLLPVNVIMPEDKEELALALNGKKQNLRRNDFLIFAENCGISRSSAEKMISTIVAKKDKFFNMVSSSFISAEQKELLRELINTRCSVFEKCGGSK